MGKKLALMGIVLRTLAVATKIICYVTNFGGCSGFVSAIDNLRDDNLPIIALQDLDQWEEK